MTFLKILARSTSDLFDITANKKITQIVMVCTEAEKKTKLLSVLEQTSANNNRILLFVGTKRTADGLTKYLRVTGWSALAIHGDKTQAERDWVLAEFKSGSAPIMIATDVAARGLDVKDIKFVINYDFPHSLEDYVHRIGRTGRAGATGTAYSFFTSQNIKNARALVHILTEANQEVPPALTEVIRYAKNFKEEGGNFRGRGRARSGGGGRGGRGKFSRAAGNFLK